MAFAKLNSMKFVGLNGLKHFWTKAKTWIAEQITAEVTAKIAEIVANAPEDLDTLKEIADWIKTHANDAAAMNTAILANTEAISGKADKNHTHIKSQITDFDHTHDDRYFTETEVTNKLAGKSDTGHTHTKSEITDFPTSLPANGGTADRAINGPFGLLGGAKVAESYNFEDLLNNELCSNQTGGLRGGSICVIPGQEAKNLGIPVDNWYNFLFIPHRTGIGGDNPNYGTLFVTPLTANDGTLYIIHRIGGHNYPAHRFNSAT